MTLALRSAKATSRFAREIEVISRWLSTALPPEFSDEKLFMTTYGQDARRLLIVQEITKSVELLKDKVDKWKRKSMAERAATAKSSEEFARLAFEDIQRNVTALVNIEVITRVHSHNFPFDCADASSLNAAVMQAVYEPDKWRGFHPEAKSFWKFFEAAWQVLARACAPIVAV
jgi:hypothetical protein